MPLTQKSKLRLRVWSVGISFSASTACAVIGSITAVQGGNFWPWACASFALYAAEITYAAIAAKRYTQQPKYIEEQDRKKRRKQQRLSPQ